MYLSRVELDYKKEETMMALSALNRFHGAVERSFPGDKVKTLWRLDSYHGKKYILILSDTKPDMTNFIKQFGVEGKDPAWECKEYDSFMERVMDGTKWHFRLTANPTFSKASKDGSRGKITAHTSPFYQKKWLIDQGAKKGFALDQNEFDIVQSQWQNFTKRGERTISILLITFEGILSVKDSSEFKKVLKDGLGRSKAYGAGLMTLVS